MSPYRDVHNCTIDETVTKITGRKILKTHWGEIEIVMGLNARGQEVPRGMRIPGRLPVSTAKEICRARGGRFEPATPLDPRNQLLSEGFKRLRREDQIGIIESYVEDFEMPEADEIELAKWSTSRVNDLPDSSFIVILRGGKKDAEGKTTPRSLRLLPYKDASGKINEAHVRNALARVNQIKASASIKRRALAKLLRIARALGMKVKEREKFKLSDLDWELSVLEKLEG